MVLYVARKRSGLTLREIGGKADGSEYKAVSKAVSRFADSLNDDKRLSARADQCLRQMSNVEIRRLWLQVDSVILGNIPVGHKYSTSL